MAVTTEELFAAALCLPVSERDHFLARACGPESGRHEELRSLLEALAQSSQFFKEAHDARSCAHAYEQIEGYRLVQELGQGGGGVVYLAEQCGPIKREVALKIIKLGMDTRAVINRFEAERQALAMMDHPNIAKVFAAGATPTGRPYFVMELVRGVRITDYCSQCRLTIAERLELFIQVCSAIEHAHQQHIVHRDIKPSNVLVTLHAGIPLAKVIDFGVAKATQGRLTDETLFTLVDQFIGTPAYVSPEQTGLDASNVDARSDIYSLGVLLYELLTGCTPLDPRELAGETLEEVRRRIREETPVIPSKRLLELTASAEKCRTSESKLLHGVRGDLDWIVMRCLEKDRARRYRSAGDLLADLTRHLENRPVLAGPPSLIYAFRKFAARHQAVLITISIVMIALLVATSLSTWQAVRARNAERLALQERENAEQVSRFLLNMFSAIDPYVNLGREPMARDLLDKAALHLRSNLSMDSEVRARIHEGIGRSYRRIRETDRAAKHLREALRLKQESRVGRGGLGALLVELAAVVREQGDVAQSDRISSAALSVLSQANEERSVAQADLLANLAILENWRGRPREALSYATQSMELLRDLKGPEDPEVGSALAEIANLMLWNDDFDGAERASREAVTIFDALPAEHPGSVSAIYQLGDVLFYRGQVGEAGELFERALNVQRRLSNGGSLTVNALGSLAQVRLVQGRIDDAEKLVAEALRLHRTSGRVDILKDGYLQTMLAMVWIKGGDLEKAEHLLRDTVRLLSAQLPSNHQYIASAEHYLGEVMLAQNDHREAQRVLSSATERWQRSDAPPWRSARSESALGQVLYQLGQWPEAERRLVNSFRVLMTDVGADEETKHTARERIVRFYTTTGQTEKLYALIDERSSIGATRAVQTRAAVN